jgi:hypothetical protein
MDFSISLYDALVAINVPADKAKAVVSALEHDMTTALATKDDLKVLSETIALRFTAQTTEFDLKLKAQRNSIVIRLGAIVIAAMALLEALHKFL